MIKKINEIILVQISFGITKNDVIKVYNMECYQILFFEKDPKSFSIFEFTNVLTNFNLNLHRNV